MRTNLSTDWDAIPKQTLLVEDGKKGDCWRCCVGALLEINALSIPNFVEHEQMDAETQDWLNKRGFAMFYAAGATGFRYPCWSQSEHRCLFISCGPTERSKGMGKHHAVITTGNPENVLYDPHPSEAGLTACTEQYFIYRIG